MVQYVITPWRDHEELLLVRRQLYPASAPGRAVINDGERRQAVSRVSVWMQRGNCPHLVESSAILTSAMLNDVPGNSAYCVRAAYSAAFCRFVTGLLDGYQDKRHKLSMYSIAKTIGLPATYVELRHQATHEELPSLPKLRIAAQKALHWIWNYYWAQLSTEIPITGDFKTLLEQFTAEQDAGRRQKIADKLKQGDEDDLITALVDFEASAAWDSTALLGALKLSKRVLHGVQERKSASVSETEESGSADLEDIRSEMARIENAMLDSDVDQSADMGQDSAEHGSSAVDVHKNDDFTSGKGWARWEGPWLPKPIGTV